ncbi:hypothetical protein CYJ76_08660 [Kytococcus schroeteri]|uniref:Uncharacterized protein n=1 Tax=Kytococcus schroeteri TaxID=138300 RepID=A0A2I1P9D6_9MICO|nr:hypothetical protein [Kytococcus schroeteri]PKZ41238.1 hypothetical protein CYJ76_08660 [Kytococcus schroeteri]
MRGTPHFKHPRDLGLDIRSALLASCLMVAATDTDKSRWIGAVHLLWVSLITAGVVLCWRALVRHDGWGGGVAAAFLAIPVLLTMVLIGALQLWPLPPDSLGAFLWYLPGATAVLCPLLAIGRSPRWDHPDGEPLPDAT